MDFEAEIKSERFRDLRIRLISRVLHQPQRRGSREGRIYARTLRPAFKLSVFTASMYMFGTERAFRGSESDCLWSQVDCCWFCGAWDLCAFSETVEERREHLGADFWKRQNESWKYRQNTKLQNCRFLKYRTFRGSFSAVSKPIFASK